MIEITCTETQKRRIIAALETGMGSIDGAVCLFPNKANFCILDPKASCKDCLSRKIKWHIVTRKGSAAHA